MLDELSGVNGGVRISVWWAAFRCVVEKKWELKRESFMGVMVLRWRCLRSREILSRFIARRKIFLSLLLNDRDGEFGTLDSCLRGLTKGFNRGTNDSLTSYVMHLCLQKVRRGAIQP